MGWNAAQAKELYVSNAERYAPRTGQESFDVQNPSTGEYLASFPNSDAQAVDRAVELARAVLPEWRTVPNRERARILKQAAARIREHADDIAAISSLEMGKTVATSRTYDLWVCAESFEFFGSVIENKQGIYVPGGPIDSYSVREPYGVVAGIIPFNWPPVHTGAKLGPALAAGNTVILKAPEQCPLAVLHIVHLLDDLFPAGVVQVLTGLGAVTGSALTSHTGIDRISFTGSPASARHVLHAAADNFTGAILELGGKNPLILLEDADLDLAVPTAIEGAFMNNSEACTAASRILVHESIAEEFTERFVEATSQLVVGHALTEGTDIGPMVTGAHKEKVDAYVEVGRQDGARLVYQGSVPEDPELADGYYVAPVVFADVTKEMRIAQEEIFGPHVAIMPFSTLEEAIEIANSTEFSFMAGVITQDMVRARVITETVDAGVVFVNNFNRSFLAATPFGGNRASGYGREHVAETIDEYSRIKSVRIPSGLAPVPRWVSGAQA